MFGIHVRHEKGRGAQGKGRKGRGVQGMAKKGRGAYNFWGRVQRHSILV